MEIKDGGRAGGEMGGCSTRLSAKGVERGGALGILFGSSTLCRFGGVSGLAGGGRYAADLFEGTAVEEEDRRGDSVTGVEAGWGDERLVDDWTLPKPGVEKFGNVG